MLIQTVSHEQFFVRIYNNTVCVTNIIYQKNKKQNKEEINNERNCSIDGRKCMEELVSERGSEVKDGQDVVILRIDENGNSDCC